MVARCHANALLHSAKDCPRLDSHCHRIATQRLRCSKQDFAAAIPCIATTTPCFAVTMRRPALLSPCSTSQRRNRTQQCFALLRLNCTSPSYAKTVLHRAITSHAPVRTPLTVTICHRNIFSAAGAASGHSSPTMRRTSSVATSANRLFKVSSSRSRISPGRSPCTFAPIPMWIVRSSVSGSAP